MSHDVFLTGLVDVRGLLFFSFFFLGGGILVLTDQRRLRNPQNVALVSIVILENSGPSEDKCHCKRAIG